MVGHSSSMDVEADAGSAPVRPGQFACEMLRSRDDTRGRTVVRLGLAVVGASCVFALSYAGASSGGGQHAGSLSARFSYEDLSQLSNIPGNERDVYYSANGHGDDQGLYFGAKSSRGPSYYRVARKHQQELQGSTSAPMYHGGRDEVPYVQMPPVTLSNRDGHVAWVRNECDDADEPCSRRWVWTDQRPHRPLLTTEFPVGEYVPTRRYPYIRGPFKHYQVTERGNIDQHGNRGGHWVFVKDTDSGEGEESAQGGAYTYPQAE